MREYEVCIETMNPCGGSEYAQRGFRDVETDNPEAWVKANAPLPILEVAQVDGSIVITTGDVHGYITKYIFTE
ncbi:MAG: hypothetical protein IKY59_04460 [Oscillospiraceae bacterium]|nr:hypothetical protein [Oscillospiraceae bacterium]